MEKFYDPPLFHASLLWLPGDQKELIETNSKLMKKVRSEIEEFSNNFDANRQKVDKLLFKTGHKIFEIVLCDNV